MIGSYTFECGFCKQTVRTDKKSQLFCSAECRKKHWEAQNPRITTVSNSTTGAISELAVAMALMQHGLHTFRALSPACPCDLTVLESTRDFANGSVYGVEVRTTVTNNGKLFFTRNSCDADFFGLFDRNTNRVYFDPITERGNHLLTRKGLPLLSEVNGTESSQSG